MNFVQLLPAIRELDSRRPEYFHHEPWELVHVLYYLNYTDDLGVERSELISSFRHFGHLKRKAA